MGSLIARMFRLLWDAIRRYFVAGIVVFAPVGITVWAIASIVTWLDSLLLPRFLKLVTPGLDAPRHFPVVGALFTFAVIILLGVITRHLFGSELVRLWERLLLRVPVARSIYGGVKQLSEALFTQSQRVSFNRVVLVEYPRKGVYAIAFTTGRTQGPAQRAAGRPVLNCFVPTTPNPTSGFYLLIPEEEVISVDLSVEDAFKLVMSAGIVAPGDESPEEEPALRSGKALPSAR